MKILRDICNFIFGWLKYWFINIIINIISFMFLNIIYVLFKVILVDMFIYVMICVKFFNFCVNRFNLFLWDFG